MTAFDNYSDWIDRWTEDPDPPDPDEDDWEGPTDDDEPRP